MVRKFVAVLFSALLFAAPLSAQVRQGGAVKADGSESGSGTVTTTGTLASGQVALGSGATSITGDTGLTWGVWPVYGETYLRAGRLQASYGLDLLSNAAKISLYDGVGGTDLSLSRASAGTLLVEDGSGNARDVQARTVLAQTLQSQGSRGGTDTNVAGGHLTIRPGAGTGSATGSSVVFQTPTAGASGTTGQTQTTRLTLSEPAVIAAVPVRLAGYTVATLPAGTVGDTAYVTDATAPTYLGALTGGGAVTTPVFYNGAAWVSH